MAFDSTLDRDVPLAVPAGRGAPLAADSRPAILAAPLSMPQPSRQPAVAASALASQPVLSPPTATPGKRTTLGASAGESMAGPGPRRGRLAAALGLGLLAALGLVTWQLRGGGGAAPSVAAVSGDSEGRPGSDGRPAAPTAARPDDKAAGALATAHPAADSAGAAPGPPREVAEDPGESDGQRGRPADHRSRRGKRRPIAGAAASSEDGATPAGAPPDKAEARPESKGAHEGQDGATPDSKAEARRPEPRDALGRHLMAVAARVAPGLRMHGAIFAERGEEGEERHRYVELSAGRCYVFVSVGSPTMEALYTYLWDPSGERVATQKEGRESIFTHCARSSGRYHFLGKAAGEAGEMRSAIFVR